MDSATDVVRTRAASGDADAKFALAGLLDGEGRHDAAAEELRQASKIGHLGATASLGERLLTGREAPFEPVEGARLITAAADRGHADAMAVLATLTGAGAWTGQSWPGALELLQKSAELGSRAARAQLALLVSDQARDSNVAIDESDPATWRRLRESVVLEAWVKPPEPRQVSQAPRIWTAEKFTTPEICAWLVGRAQGKFKPSMMFDGQRSTFLATRTCSDFAFTIVEGGVLLVLLRIRAGLLTGLSTVQMEPPQIFHYSIGQEIKPHYDSVYDGEHSYGQTGGYQGDRLATFLLYLNDTYEGGELEFPKVGFRHRGKTGDGIFFTSQREGKRDNLSLHGALPVTAGEKFILSQWIHDRPFQA
jgi:prolyl 4-hydroxylase